MTVNNPGTTGTTPPPVSIADDPSRISLDRDLKAHTAETGLSKTAVIERLQAQGLRRARTGRELENYKFARTLPMDSGSRGVGWCPTAKR